MVQTLIAKNTAYLTVSSIVQKVLAFLWFAYVANQLGEDDLGKYTFAVTYASIFVIIMNFGLIPVVTREGAKMNDHAAFERQFQSIITLKVVLTVVSLVLMFGVFHILNIFKELPSITITLVYLASVIIVIDTFRSIFIAVLRARQEMHYEAIGQLLYQVIVIAFGIILFRIGFHAAGLIVAIILASLFYLLYGFIIVVWKTHFRLHFQWNAAMIKQLVVVAIPFALADIFFKLNGSVDTVMLEYLAGDRYVAWYNIALKLTMTLTVIPGAFATAFFPAMSKAYVESKEHLRSIFEQSFLYLLMIGLPIAAGTAILAERIITVGFPAFPAAIPALQLFMGALVFLFLNYPIGNLLNAVNRQLLNTVNMGIALVVNIVINFFLIPVFTYRGATIAALVSSIVLVLLGLPHVYHEVRFHVWSMLWRAVKILVATAAMAVFLWWLSNIGGKEWTWLVLNIAVGFLVYGVALLCLRALTIAECKQLWQALRQKLS